MISVIIPHLNQEKALRRCLASLCEQGGLREPAEIIVVDNGSLALPDKVCADFPGVVLLQQPEPGPGPARNLGVSTARGDILAFIDADCVAEETWLSTIERRFEGSPQTTILGGNVRILYDDPGQITLLEAYESVFAYRMKEYIEKRGFTGGGNLAMRAEVFRAVGPFGGITIAEDTEWGQRASRLGFRIRYASEMIVYHPARKTFTELSRKWDRHIAHDFAEMRGEQFWWPRWVLRSAAVALSPVAECRRILVSDRLIGARARLLAFLGVVQIRFYRVRVMLALAGGADVSDLSARWNRP
ncbi:glycosyltransferase [Aureimonas sp. AU40]|uniref:glycosyltransferase n=1 Tax=Aureimonas sp. AU40 TaxID=1637747 RepID=UPI000781ABB3|nr:glycosyltransferase [Aureimonas sp. AU40]